MPDYLEVIQECDNFPFYDFNDPEPYQSFMSRLWQFHLPNSKSPYGYVIESTVAQMPWTSDFRVAFEPRKEIHLLPPSGINEKTDLANACYKALDNLVEKAIAIDIFTNSKGWKGEHFGVLGAPFPFKVHRAFASHLGIVTRGAQLTVYTRTHDDDNNNDDEMKIWIPRRSKNKSTYPGMLDNAVGGGIQSGEMPLEALIREASEEAGLPESLIRNHSRPGGTISWFNVKDKKAGSDMGLLEPGVQYVYDLEVPPDLVLKPGEEDVESFNLMSISEVKAALGRKEFKPSCGVVMIDFFVRHGIINAENEKDFGEIVARLHRRLPFPTDYWIE